MVTLLLSRIGSLNCQQHVATGLLDEAHRLVDIGWSLVRDLIIATEILSGFTLLLILRILSFSRSPARWLWPPGTIFATNTPTWRMMTWSGIEDT